HVWLAQEPFLLFPSVNRRLIADVTLFSLSLVRLGPNCESRQPFCGDSASSAIADVTQMGLTTNAAPRKLEPYHHLFDAAHRCSGSGQGHARFGFWSPSFWSPSSPALFRRRLSKPMRLPAPLLRMPVTTRPAVTTPADITPAVITTTAAHIRAP